MAAPLSTHQVAADSAAAPIGLRATCLRINSPVALATERGDTLCRDPGFRSGIEPQERAVLPGYDSGAMILLIGAFLILAFNFRHYSTFLKTFTQDLWSVRPRGNVFDDHTVSETRIMVSLVLLVCICEGILAFCAVNAGSPAGAAGVFPAIASAVGIAGGYYVWQLAAYSVTGYAFGSKGMRRRWLKGFNASQALLGLALTVPAVLALFNPAMAPALAAAGAVLYAIARIIFICKGFRLFYHNLFSLIYFILYLCTLEIAPLYFLWKVL